MLRWGDLEYEVSVSDDFLVLIALPCSNGLPPPGSVEDWKKIVRQEAKKRGAKRYAFYRQTRDSRMRTSTTKRIFEAKIDGENEVIIYYELS